MKGAWELRCQWLEPTRVDRSPVWTAPLTPHNVGPEQDDPQGVFLATAETIIAYNLTMTAAGCLSEESRDKLQ